MRLAGICFIIFGLIACGTKQEGNTVKREPFILATTGSFSINPYLDSITHAFIREANCKDCIYEMYFDKQDDTDSKVTLHCIPSYPAYMQVNKPILFFNVDSIRFFVYTGLEDFVVLHNDNNTTTHLKASSSLTEHVWAVITTKDSTYVVHDGWPPFIKMQLKPDIKFEAPGGVK
ncbi:hypothetical protein [Chitinophaga sancti]|uniref:hypothetical protein n=1 Tax=Chitinophaga sancti TaxID=1004 RepID=UPI003F7A1D57